MTPLDYISGYFLDLLFGDPDFLPHPVRAIGKLIEVLVARFQKDSSKRLQGIVAGAVVWLTTVSVTGFVVALMLSAAAGLGKICFHLLSIYLVYAVLATRCLHAESHKVFYFLESSDIIAARASLKNIVTRDTENMSEESVLRALLETVSENIVDGIGSPLFYLVVGGPPIAWMYKASNTLDSMIGYKTTKYLYLGKFSARADDLLNYVPARITGLFMLLSSALLRYDWKNGLKTWLRDARKHSSPNAGIPEAILAGSLGIQLGGVGSYFGKTVSKPTLGDPQTTIKTVHYKKAIKLLYLTSLLLFFAGLITIMILSNYWP